MGYFSGPGSMFVKAGQTSTYPISFFPLRCGDHVTSVLSLVISQTNQKFVYNLKGFGEEPLPEETLDIKMSAKEHISRPIFLKNNSDKRAQYRIETSTSSSLLRAWISTSAENIYSENVPVSLDRISVDSRSTCTMYLHVYPLASGSFNTAVNLKSEDDAQAYFWYNAEVMASIAAPLGVIKLITTARVPIVQKIAIKNSTTQLAKFTVTIEGAGLIGEDNFELSPLSSYEYHLKYSPS